MQLVELTITQKDGSLVSHTFLDGDEYKTVISDDYDIQIKIKGPSEDEPSA